MRRKSRVSCADHAGQVFFPVELAARHVQCGFAEGGKEALGEGKTAEEQNGAVAVARRLGYSIPDDLSVIGWDDSLLCELVQPPLTALHRDIFRYGGLCARHLVMVIEGGQPGDVPGTETRLIVRGSTGPPPAR